MMSNEQKFTLEDLTGTISRDLEKVEEGLLSEVDPVLSSIKFMNHYVHNSGGKRLRPTLLLYIAGILGGDMETARQLAIVIEYIHAATLVHDDVIDASEMRRGRESLNALRRNKEAVLFGDWLHMTSFWKALELKDFRFLQTLIQATRQMVEGELLQMQMASCPDVTSEIREEITFCKTAGLFGCCCRLGALSSRAGVDTIDGFTRYGEALGMSFQLVDDLLDYSSRSEDLGKPVLQDLEEGNITLPIIYLIEEADEPERKYIKKVIKAGNPDRQAKENILELIGKYGCLERGAEKARSYSAQARAALSGLPLAEKDRKLLEQLPDWILSRSF